MYPLPRHDFVSNKIEAKKRINPLEEFIYLNEPAGKSDRVFRSGLSAAIVYCVREIAGEDITAAIAAADRLASVLKDMVWSQRKKDRPCPFCGGEAFLIGGAPELLTCQQRGCSLCSVYVKRDEWNNRDG